MGKNMSNRHIGDYAVVGVHKGNVFLEANEWDVTVGRHFVVTLYLEPEEAIQLAEQINLCARGAEKGGQADA